VKSPLNIMFSHTVTLSYLQETIMLRKLTHVALPEEPASFFFA
jgi:hypothetical protein